MLMWMIGKLGKYQKADWPKHLQELVHAYNSMQLAVMGYSLHYLMFGQQIVSREKHQHVNYYIADLCE